MSLDLGFEQEIPEANPLSDPTVGEVAEAAFDLGANDRITNVLTRGQQVDDLNDQGKRLSPEEINAQFPELKADRPLTISAARFIDDFNREKRAKEEIISSASGLFKGTIVPFAAGSISSAIDPIDGAVGFGVGAGFSLASKLGSTATRKFALELTENAVANTIAEGFVAQEAGERFEEYTTDQFLTNVIGGSIVSTTAFRGFGAAARASHQGFKTIQNLGSKISDATYRLSNALESQELPSRRILEDFFTPVLDKFKKNPDVDTQLKESFGERVEAGDDLLETYSNVGEAFREGKIDEAELENFINTSRNIGVDDRAIKNIDDRNEIEFTDEEISDFNNIAESYKENSEAMNVEKQADVYDGIKAQDDLARSADELIASDPDNPVFQEVKQNLETLQRSQDLLREFHNCRRA